MINTEKCFQCQVLKILPFNFQNVEHNNLAGRNTRYNLIRYNL